MTTHEKPCSVHATFYPQSARRLARGESYVYPYTIRVLDDYGCEVMRWSGNTIDDCISVARAYVCPLFVRSCHDDSYRATNEYPIYYDMEA